jgi:hypothetical protein
VFLPTFRYGSSTIWLSSQHSDVVSARVEKCCHQFFVPLPTPPEPPGTVAATAAADPVDFEAMTTKRNCCAERQRLLGGSSLKIYFRQAGTQRLFGDVSTGVFCPEVGNVTPKM